MTPSGSHRWPPLERLRERAMLTQANDFRDECDALYGVLKDIPDRDWTQSTQFNDWTFNDVIGHLYLFDHAAKLTLEGPPTLKAFFAEIAAGRAGGDSLASYTRRWVADAQGSALLARWQSSYLDLAGLYAEQDPIRRVAWGGPDMSVRSCISARQMETWAHGQAVFDALGKTRSEGDRIRNIAVIGVNTFGWTFSNRGLDIPAIKPYVRLTSPSGAVWNWNSPQQVDRVEGSAVDFCRVVTQTRNVADTALEIVGEVARHWMSIAQCFAGPPVNPPKPNTRYVQ
jgi:uncharacterized protein (TIGR03084 family)